MTEAQLQNKIVMWFSQTYPEHRGLLWENNNDTYNVRNAMRRRAMGMLAGVADIIICLPDNGKLLAIELKAPGSRHDKEHVRQQIEWGLKIMTTGAMYYIGWDFSKVRELIELALSGDISAALECSQSVTKVIVMLDRPGRTVVFSETKNK